MIETVSEIYGPDPNWVGTVDLKGSQGSSGSEVNALGFGTAMVRPPTVYN